MTIPVPEREGMDDAAPHLADALAALLEFTGATAGWVGCLDEAGRLSFPVRRGDFPPSWLTLQQARAGAWGFEIREGPTLLNNLPPLPALGEPPLRNLLSCPLDGVTTVPGHVALANKPSGFTSHDAAVLQAVAHLMARQLARTAWPRAAEPPPFLGRVLDRIDEGILVVDAAGTLVYVNAAWLRWTGFAAEELVGRPAPFPFWVSHRDLAALAGTASGWPAEAAPFRRHDRSVFWCQVETVREEWRGCHWAVTRLRQVPSPAPSLPPTRRPVSLPLLLEELPFAVALLGPDGRVLWAGATLTHLVGKPVEPATLLADCFPQEAETLQEVLRNPDNARPGRAGRLTLHGEREPLHALWLTVETPGGPGLLLAVTDRPEGPFASVDVPSTLRLPGHLRADLPGEATGPHPQAGRPAAETGPEEERAEEHGR